MIDPLSQMQREITKKISSYLRHLLSEHLEPIGDLLELLLHLLVGDKVSNLLADGAAWRK